jgi:hypothetical protein
LRKWEITSYGIYKTILPCEKSSQVWNHKHDMWLIQIPHRRYNKTNMKISFGHCTVAIAQCNLHSVPRCGRKSSTGLTAQISCCCQFWLKKYEIEIEAGDSPHTRVFEWWTFVKFLQHGNKKITTILSKYKNVFFFVLQIFQLVITCWSNFDFLAGRRMSESFRYRRQIWFKFNSEPSFGFNTSGLTINSLGNITILIAPYSL